MQTSLELSQLVRVLPDSCKQTTEIYLNSTQPGERILCNCCKSTAAVCANCSPCVSHCYATTMDMSTQIGHLLNDTAIATRRLHLRCHGIHHRLQTVVIGSANRVKRPATYCRSNVGYTSATAVLLVIADNLQASAIRWLSLLRPPAEAGRIDAAWHPANKPHAASCQPAVSAMTSC